MFIYLTVLFIYIYIKYPITYYTILYVVVASAGLVFFFFFLIKRKTDIINHIQKSPITAALLPTEKQPQGIQPSCREARAQHAVTTTYVATLFCATVMLMVLE